MPQNKPLKQDKEHKCYPINKQKVSKETYEAAQKVVGIFSLLAHESFRVPPKEIHQIMNNPKLLNATDFYENGNIVPKQDVINRYTKSLKG